LNIWKTISFRRITLPQVTAMWHFYHNLFWTESSCLCPTARDLSFDSSYGYRWIVDYIPVLQNPVLFEVVPLKNKFVWSRVPWFAVSKTVTDTRMSFWCGYTEFITRECRENYTVFYTKWIAYSVILGADYDSPIAHNKGFTGSLEAFSPREVFFACE
jgi:hypothetical protein